MAVHGAVAETCTRCFLEDSSSGTASLEHNEAKAGLNSLSFILWSNLQNLGKLSNVFSRSVPYRHHLSNCCWLFLRWFLSPGCTLTWCNSESGPFIALRAQCLIILRMRLVGNSCFTNWVNKSTPLPPSSSMQSSARALCIVTVPSAPCPWAGAGSAALDGCPRSACCGPSGLFGDSCPEPSLLPRTLLCPAVPFAHAPALPK